MPQIIAFVSPKGGCGATSVCGLLWYSLCRMGFKVLGVDMCFENCSLDFMLGRENDYIYTLSDVSDGLCRLEDICPTGESDFARCGYDAKGFDYAKVSGLLGNSGYDYILADCPACCPVEDFADRIVVVTDTAPVSVRFCEEFVQRTWDIPVSVVINKIVAPLIDDGVHPTVDRILEIIGTGLLGLVPSDMYINYIPQNGFASRTDGSCLYECFSNIAERLTGKTVPAYDIDGFFRGIKTYKYMTKGRK